MSRGHWHWYIVVDESGNCEEVFNSKPGAEGYAEEYGGTVILVQEVEKTEWRRNDVKNDT